MSTNRSLLKFGTCIAALVACQLLAAPSQADTIYDNVNNSFSGFSSVASLGPLGASFGVTQNYSITDIKLQLWAENTDTNSFMVFIANQVAGAPDLNIADALASTTFSDSIFSSTFTPQVVDWTLSSPASLTSGTYWVVVQDSNGTSVDWLQESGDSGTGVAGQNSYASSTVTPNSSGAMLMAVNGTPGSGVPEPTGIAIVGSALVGLSLVRRRFSKSSRS